MSKEYKNLTIFVVAVVVVGVGACLLLLLFVGKQLEQSKTEMVALEQQAAKAPEERLDEQLGEVASSTYPADVVAAPGHQASGTARVVTANGKTYLRYENFKTDNGCNLHVYLATDEQAANFINLGKLKAIEGNFSYEIPGIVVPQQYPHALVWCRDRNVLFNSARLYSF